ncbi:MAG TPA: division plane positioning ATPase MipZ [Polyangia bacterium]
MFTNRVTVLLGLEGSGKTSLAVAGAVALARRGARVTVIDLDAGCPSFQRPEARRPLEQRGVGVLAAEWAPLTEDASLVVARTRRLLEDLGTRAVLDVGADPASLAAYAKIADAVPRDADRLFVVNFHRPFTEDAAGAAAAAARLCRRAGTTLTGIVCNTHLMAETTPEVVLAGCRLAEELGATLGVPVVAVTAQEHVGPALDPARLGCLVLPVGAAAPASPAAVAPALRVVAAPRRRG